MVTKTATGNTWSDAGHWSPSGVPANGDAVIIPSEIDMTLDVDQSGFANGLLSLQIDGILRFKVDSITALKMNGNVTGSGSLYVGNSEADPIQRPPSGSESRCQLIFNSTATINVPTIRMYGWYPEREYSQLDADAALNATTIVLKEDLGLQAGDKIGIGSGTEINATVESNVGIYTVQAYDSNTKTITLSGGLQTARLTNDYICYLSRPIKISRTSGNNAFITANITNLINITGVCVSNGGLYQKLDITTTDNWDTRIIAQHCSTLTRQLFYYGNGMIAKDCNSVAKNYGMVSASVDSLIERCIGINNTMVYGCGYSTIVKNSVTQNGAYIPTCTVINSIILNCAGIYTTVLGRANNLIVHLDSSLVLRPDFCSKGELYNSTIKSGSKLLNNEVIKFDNCIFEDNVTILYQKNYAWMSPSESFNHNQIPGNYKAWMRGGRIITEDNKLKFICESNDYPVFRDYPILAPANRVAKFLIGLTKDTAGISTKLQIIDPSNDPLIDTTATPLAESTAQDTTDNQQIGVAYKSSTPRQLILRILCQNSSGEVLVDTTRIDQSLAKKITSLN